ncbi:MAG TPA: mechanosensitive ion channel domain-containing protein [Flavobacterium sp.]|nr:mechanosensitive ion channel domain-containing protein [Flavobacterium sp.]
MNIMNENIQSRIYEFGLDIWLKTGVNLDTAHIFNSIVLTIVLFAVLFGMDYILRRMVVFMVIKAVRRSKTKIDDYMIRNRVLKNVSHLIPLWIAYQAFPVIFTGFPQWTSAMQKFTGVLIIITFIALFRSLAGTFKDFLLDKKSFADKPLDSYFQVVSIILYIIGSVLIVTHLFGISPLTILGSFGAASAILLLVFKDTILGLVASIQVSANDSVRVGDWIEMPKYGVDGDVLQINLNNVRVQNWDKTIVTIPTHTLMSDSFKNYRGMQMSGGRRIKRSINIKLGSIRFLETDEIEELKRIKLLKNYIVERQQQIAEYNRTHIDDPTMLVNGRRMTNIGLFREYVRLYLLNVADTNKRLSMMVRHLQPTEHGLPLEIYAFANTVKWVDYEGIMADIFDHVLSVVPYFHLELFELPNSKDFQELLLAQYNEMKQSE